MSTKFALILEDLKSSWFFRIWALLWLVCAVMTFVALVMFSRYSNLQGHEGSARIWFERPAKINFPDFQIFAPRGVTLTSSVCKYMEEEVSKVDCVGWVKEVSPPLSCTAFQASSKQGYYDAQNFRTSRIDCNITTDLEKWNNTEDLMIGWEQYDSHPAGPNSRGPIWVRPTELAWILVSRREFQTKDWSGAFWDRFLTYHETQAIAGKYRIETVLDNFFHRAHQLWRSLSWMGSCCKYWWLWILHLHSAHIGSGNNRNFPR